MAFSIDVSTLDERPIQPEQPLAGAVVSAGSASTQSSSEQGTADAIGDVVGGGTHEGVSVVYDSGDRTLDITNTDKGSVAVTAHEAALDPHPQYETAAEVAAQITTHSGATDPHGDRAFATAADSAAISAHNAASDPHGDRAFATSAIATHSAATDPHGDRAYTNSKIASGTYTPTVTSLWNATGSAPFGDWHWSRTGSMVTVGGLITIVRGAAVGAPTESDVSMTLPVPSTFSQVYHAAGSAATATTAAAAAAGGARFIAVVGGTPRVSLFLYGPSSTTSLWSFTFTYRVI